MIRFNMRAITVVAVLSAALGAQQLRLTASSGGGERQPVLSADGTTVAYVAMVGGSREVFTVPVDGGAPVQRTTAARVRVGNGVFDTWPSLSISADGTKITYWNAAGVHVLDTAASTDVVVAPANAIPYPRIDAGGSWVVYQAPVSGRQEVFLVPATGGAAQTISTASGAGRRLPDVALLGGTAVVLYQTTVAGFLELALFDVAAGTSTVLTTGSGPGNRYARLSEDGRTFVYDASPSGQKEVWIGSTVSGAPQALTTLANGGDRLAVVGRDGQVFFQATSTNLEVHRIDDDGTDLIALSATSSGGLRRVDADRLGHVFVYQSEHAGTLEVFQERLCSEFVRTPFGVHGQPSVGSLSLDEAWYRCNLSLNLRTSLPGNSAAFLLAPQGLLPGLPLPGAPGNFLYVQSAIAIPIAIGAGGVAAVVAPIDVSVVGTAYYQWAILDAPANALGVVTSQGVQVDF